MALIGLNIKKETTAAGGDKSDGRGKVWSGLRTLISAKVGWALVAALTFVPLAVWEIWAKTPWGTYEQASRHIFTNDAIKESLRTTGSPGGGNPVQSKNRAFWATFDFFEAEALKLPGALLGFRLRELSDEFAAAIDARVVEAMNSTSVTSGGELRMMHEGFDHLFDGIEAPRPISLPAGPASPPPETDSYSGEYEKVLPKETERRHPALATPDETAKGHCEGAEDSDLCVQNTSR